MFVDTLTTNANFFDESSLADTIQDRIPATVDASTEIAWVAEKQLPVLPAILRHEGFIRGGLALDDENYGTITRFLRADGPSEMLVRQGPLPEKDFALMSQLREVVQDGDEPLGYCPVAVGNTLVICATNEKTMEAFRLLAQKALGKHFQLVL